MAKRNKAKQNKYRHSTAKGTELLVEGAAPATEFPQLCCFLSLAVSKRLFYPHPALPLLKNRQKNTGRGREERERERERERALVDLRTPIDLSHSLPYSLLLSPSPSPPPTLHLSPLLPLFLSTSTPRLTATFIYRMVGSVPPLPLTLCLSFSRTFFLSSHPPPPSPHRVASVHSPPPFVLCSPFPPHLLSLSPPSLFLLSHSLLRSCACGCCFCRDGAKGTEEVGRGSGKVVLATKAGCDRWDDRRKRVLLVPLFLFVVSNLSLSFSPAGADLVLLFPRHAFSRVNAACVALVFAKTAKQRGRTPPEAKEHLPFPHTHTRAQRLCGFGAHFGFGVPLGVRGLARGRGVWVGGC
eukprot:Rhum_TRINITY_DN14749_c19_g1::Rhum_TRINITY_DN14749_c19_g1_i1::g.116710::m.116710